MIDEQRLYQSGLNRAAVDQLSALGRQVDAVSVVADAALPISGAAATGAKAAAMTSTNKPGTHDKTQPDAWLPVTVGTTLYYLPLYLP